MRTTSPAENKTVLLSLKTQSKYVNEETRKYACCGCIPLHEGLVIPLHAGVVIIAVLELMLAVGSIRFVFWIKERIVDDGMDMDDGNNISLQLLIFPVLYLIACCFGIIGALNEYKRMIGVFRSCYICGGIIFACPLIITLCIVPGAWIWLIITMALRIYFTRVIKKYYDVMKSRDDTSLQLTK